MILFRTPYPIVDYISIAAGLERGLERLRTFSAGAMRSQYTNHQSSQAAFAEARERAARGRHLTRFSAGRTLQGLKWKARRVHQPQVAEWSR